MASGAILNAASRGGPNTLGRPRYSYHSWRLGMIMGDARRAGPLRLGVRHHFQCHRDIEGIMNSSKLRPDSSVSLMVDLACLFLPLVVSLLPLVAEVVMLSVCGNTRSVRGSAFPLVLISALLFPFGAVVSSRRSATRGGPWVQGSLASIVLGLAILGCSLLFVFIGGFEMK